LAEIAEKLPINTSAEWNHHGHNEEKEPPMDADERK
jgi:hypothetical protein